MLDAHADSSSDMLHHAICLHTESLYQKVKDGGRWRRGKLQPVSLSLRIFY